VIIQMGQASSYADFAAFRTSVIANALTFSTATVPNTLNYTSEAGDVFTFYANSKTTPKVNGSTVNLNPTKTYDGTPTATLTSADYSVSGWVAGEGATVTKTTGTYNSANAGYPYTGRSVTVSLAGSDYLATGATLLYIFACCYYINRNS
jgi:hypothetical protein